MNKVEASDILRRTMKRYREKTYVELSSGVGEVVAFQIVGDSGCEYTVELEVMWDHHPYGNIRVIGSIDDQTLRHALAPMCEDFILSTDGTFVGE